MKIFSRMLDRALHWSRHDVLHADETPVAMLKPGHGKTHRAYLWSYCTTRFNPVQAVVFDFAESRGGQHVREFLGLPNHADRPPWLGRLVTDDYSGYKACFELGVTEVGCWAHARRKFHELWANHGSTVAEQPLTFFSALYDVERDIADLAAPERRKIRRQRAGPVAAKAIDYTLNRWRALTRYLEDGELPIDNNWVENQIRPIAIGRSNWLFTGSLRAGQRAAAVKGAGGICFATLRKSIWRTGSMDRWVRVETKRPAFRRPLLVASNASLTRFSRSCVVRANRGRPGH